MELHKIVFQSASETVCEDETRICVIPIIPFSDTLLGIGPAKRRALRTYEEILKREGLPEPFVAQLVAVYNLGFGKLLRRGFSRFRARG